MPSLRSSLLVLIWLMCSPCALAQNSDLLERLTPRGYVNDYAEVFPEPESRSLELLLGELDRKTTTQVAIVTVASLEGEDITDFANRLFNQWGIGRKGSDRGLLLLLSTGDRRVRVEVGYGLEGLLPDGRVGRILDQQALPWFRQGNYAAGLLNSVHTIAQLVAEDAAVTLDSLGEIPNAQRIPQERPLSWFEMIAGLILLAILIPLFIRHPWLFFLLLNSGGGRRGGGFGGGGFGGFGGGMSGGGGAGRSW